MRWKKRFGALAQRAVDAALGGGLSQQETTAVSGRRVTPGTGALIRRLGAEGCVLLKNDGTLPLQKEREIAVFGRCQLDWFYVGYGSGGNVNAPYVINLMEGLDNAGAAYNKALAKCYRTWCGSEENRADHGWWGHWPYSHPEMPLDGVTVRFAAERADTAVVVLGRAAGEDRDSTLTKGSYYLTDAERDMLRAVTAAFRHTVVLLNTGGVMDMAWTEKYPVSALLLVWQGGMESGNAVCDVLYGAVNPCGRLTDTIARRYEDYPSSAHFGGKRFNDYAEGIFVGYRHFDTFAPERVLYPFGFGLSYTAFETKALSFARDAQSGVTARVRVVNKGAHPGRETVLLWCEPPGEGLQKPKRVLAAFAKTGTLAPGDSETLALTCENKTLASFDETARAFVLEAGEYRFTAGDGRVEAGRFALDRSEMLERCEAVCLEPNKLRRRILERLPGEITAGGGSGTLADVAAGRLALDDFIAGLSDAELEALTRGHGMMSSALGVPGNAGVFGGVTEALRRRGVPPVVCCDGPAGVRVSRYCSLVPCGTALACTFDTALVERLYALVGAELVRCGADVLLAPGMNIHRNPLCGRNFEYFSEDPLLSGKMGAAVTRGVQSAGAAACPKHFACNNQERNRNRNDSRAGERALREIYLRGFEICVKEGGSLCLMTSYNKVNGVWAHYHYGLATTVLRGEWGFDGMVMTDWWMRRARSPEFPRLRDNAYRVRAQVDVLMPGSMSHLAKRCRSGAALLRTLGRPGGITRAELQRGARNVLRLCLRLMENKEADAPRAAEDDGKGVECR